MGVDDDVIEVSTSVLGTLAKAELDVAITTARRFPRELTKFRSEVRSMCTVNEEVAEACLYSLERTDRDGHRTDIDGPSIRMAEIVLSAWGNAQVVGRVIDEGKDFVVGQGVFRDLQRNVTVSKEVRRRITTREGRRYSADMIQVTSQAAVSIAIRNAIFGGIPGAFWNESYEAARSVAAGTLETLDKRRTSALAYCAGKGIDAQRVFAYLGVAGLEDVDLDLLVKLRTRVAMLKNGEIRITEAFPAPEPEGETVQPETKGMAGLKARVTPKATVTAEEPTTVTLAATPEQVAALDAGIKPGVSVGLDASTARSAAVDEAIEQVSGRPWREVLKGEAGAPLPQCSRCTSEAEARLGDLYFCRKHEPKPK